MKIAGRKILLVYISLIYSFVAHTQNKIIDSLQKILQTQGNDTNKVNTLNALCYELVSGALYKNALHYGEDALLLTERLGFKKGRGYACKYLGMAYYNLANYSEGSKNLFAALNIFEETGNKKEVAHLLQLIGGVSFELGNNSAALKSLFAALKFREEIGEKWGIAQTYNSIGMVYSKQGKYTEAFLKHFAALKICTDPEFKGPNWSFPFTNECIANVYEKQGDELNIKGEKKAAANEYDKAFKTYLATSEIWRKIGRMDALAEIYVNIGNIQVKLKKFASGKDYFSKALKLNLTSEIKETTKNIYLGLSILDSVQGNYFQAYQHYKMYILFRDSIVNEESIRKIEGYKMQNEFDKKEDKIKLLSTQNKLQMALVQQEGQRKKFAYAGIGIILLAGGYGFYRFRKRKRFQNQQALMKERLRISRELHDEVGATLSGIAMYSHLTKEQIKNERSTEVEKSLNIMQQSAGEMVNKLNDIVWLINPDQDSLQKLVQRLEEYARDMAMVKNMQVKVNVPAHLAEHSLPVESRRNIYLFCKEAINNAVKYSNGTLLELNIKEVGNKLEFSVSDNGKGFDAVMVRRGNGLNNMQQRADDLGAKLTVQSKKGEGSFISMQIKIT